MANYTTNLSLKKPVDADGFDIQDFNGNADKIDAAFGAGFGQSGAASVFSSIATKADSSKAVQERGLQNVNIDNITTPGCGWVQAANASGTQPGYNYYFLNTFVNGNGQLMQIASQMIDADTSIRIYANGAWIAWQELAPKSDITALNSNIANRALYFDIDSVPYNSDDKEVIISAVNTVISSLVTGNACVFRGFVSGVSIIGGLMLKYDNNLHIATMNYRNNLYTVQKDGNNFTISLVTATTI